jgi:hypothetical protein
MCIKEDISNILLQIKPQLSSLQLDTQLTNLSWLTVAIKRRVTLNYSPLHTNPIDRQRESIFAFVVSKTVVVRFQVLTAVSMMFRFVFWDILPLMMEAVRTSETLVDNHFTWQYIPEDNSEQNCS